MEIKRSMLVIILFAVSNLFLMAQGKYCFSFTDYLDRKMEDCPLLEMKTPMKGERILSETAGFQPATGDKKVDKMLRKKVRIIVKGDSIFVNYKGLHFKNKKLGEGYGRGFLIKNKIFFSGPVRTNSLLVTTAGVMFGVLGSVVAAVAEHKPHMRLFMLGDDTGNVRLVKKEYLGVLLAGHEKLKIAYLSEDNPDDPRIIWKYLQKLAER